MAHQIATEETSQEILGKVNVLEKKISGIENYLDIGGSVKRYGVCIDKNESDPSKRVTYLGDARNMIPAHMNFSSGEFEYGDWADVWFVKNNKPLMLRSDGTVDYYLNPNDYSKKESGGSSDIANTSYNGNAMAQFPLVWFKQYESAGKMYLWACETQYDETYKAYAHTRADGTIADYFYSAIYGGSSISSKMRSLSNQNLQNSVTADTQRTQAMANGSGWDIRSWSQRNYLINLLTLIGCNDDTQQVFGYGNCRSAQNAGGLLKTGTLDQKGQFWGIDNSTTQVKVFHVEGPWGDWWDRITGMMYNGEGILIKMTPPYNLTGDGYIRTGVKISGGSGGYISKTTMNEYGRLPLVTSGSATTYECDSCWFNAGQLDMALVGAGADPASSAGGAFTLTLNNAPSAAGWAYGAALSYL